MFIRYMLLICVGFLPVYSKQAPVSCISPTGESCDWYSTCENVYGPTNCTGRDNYAVNYGEKYCKKYNATYHLFSEEGKIWIGEVSKCLQEALVPTLDAGLTCQQVKDIAFKSHPGCYVNSGLCSLPFSDWLKILYTVRQAFSDEFTETMTSAIKSAVRCIWCQWLCIRFIKWNYLSFVKPPLLNGSL